MIKLIWTWIQKKVFWGVLRHWVSDRKYAELRYRIEQSQPLNLEEPARFTEKIQWIKLYERTELRKKVADRLKARYYIAKKVGEQYLIPLIDQFEELTPEIWEALPGQFVLKANHGCGMVEIVQDKSIARYTEVKDETHSWQQTEYFNVGREWVYKGLPRTLMAEKLLKDEDGEIPCDYKFFCFHGRVEIIQVDIDRFGDQKRNLYDRNFNRMKGRLLYPNYNGMLPKPGNLDQAIHTAETLAEEFSFLRVDLYLEEDQVKVGELTNYPGNGFIHFEPESLELWAGSLLKLQQSNKTG